MLNYLKGEKKLLLCSSLVLISILVSGQNIGLKWARSFGTDNKDVGHSVAVDQMGNVYSVGYFYGTVDFDPTATTYLLSSNGASDAYIQKLDSNGNFLWAKTIGGTSGDYANAIVVDKNGNTYTVGSYDGNVDFDPNIGTFNITSTYASDAFILKLDSDGNFIWANSSGDWANDIALDQDGNILILGEFNGTSDFNPGLGVHSESTKGGEDVYIQKLDANGQFIWVKVFGNSRIDWAISLGVDRQGSVYASGVFKDIVDFDPSGDVFNMTSQGDYDIYTLKLNSQGGFEWARRIGSFQDDWPGSIAISENGDVYTAGRFFGTIDINPNGENKYITSNGFNDIFIQKLNSEGEFLWGQNLGNTWNDAGAAVSLDSADNPIVCGFFNRTVDFDASSGVSSLDASNGNMFIGKWDGDGDILWVKNMAGIGNRLACDNKGGIYATGEFSYTGDFDPNIGVTNLTSNGRNDAFVLKLQDCNTYTMLYDTICTGDSIFFADQFLKEKINIRDTFRNAAGCDSIVKMHLELWPRYNDTIEDYVVCDSFTWIDGKTYYESDTVSEHTLLSVHGCDSIIRLNLKIVKTPKMRLTNDTTICFGDSIELYLDTKADTILWSTGEEGSQIIGNQGKYVVTATNGQCIATDSVYITQQESLSILLADKYYICEKEKDIVKLDAGKGFSTYLWTPTEDTTQWIIVQAYGDHFVHVTDFRGCLGDKGTNVLKRCDMKYDIPNAFSPNNDGLNDFFNAIGNDIESVQLSIYNRWGELIYKSNNMNGWSGENAMTGVYLFKMEIHGFLKKERVTYYESGTVTLLR